jgi:serine protease Do
VNDSRQLKLRVARVKPGENVEVKVLREGSEKTLSVKVGDQPNLERLARSDRQQPAAKDTGTLNGVAVEDLDRQARREFDIPSNVTGALVTEVAPESAAADAGLSPGDVILELNRQPVKSAEDAIRLTEKTQEKTTLVKLWSKGGQRFVVVDDSRTS